MAQHRPLGVKTAGNALIKNLLVKPLHNTQKPLTFATVQ